jgi:hypothetical protein
MIIAMRVFFRTVWIAAALCSCSNAPKQSGAVAPLPAHLIASDGSLVPGAPEPEVVRLVKIENVGAEKHVTVGNVAGDYVLVCNLEVNNAEKFALHSCLSPQPQKDYLLFREGTKWKVNGGQHPIDLKFFQDWSVSYNDGENVGLMLAKSKEPGEDFGVYWLQSWTVKSPAR